MSLLLPIETVLILSTTDFSLKLMSATPGPTVTYKPDGLREKRADELRNRVHVNYIDSAQNGATNINS